MLLSPASFLELDQELAMLAERDQWLNGQTMPDSRSNAQDPADTYCLGGLAARKMGELKARTFGVVE